MEQATAAPNIGVEEFLALPEGAAHVIDVRSRMDAAYGLIPGALVCPTDELWETLPPNDGKIFIVYCKHGAIGEGAAAQMREKGYDARNLEGGYLAWLMETMRREDDAALRQRVDNSIQKKFRHRLWTRFARAIKNYRLVNEGDCIGVCISGGKDSMLMAKLFSQFQKYSDVPFTVHYIVMDPGYSAENRKVIEDNARKLGIPIEIFETDIFESVYNIEKNPCYLCARMRRGYLYSYAKSLGCNKIALGHHYDDVIETILMGMLYGAQVQTMMPKLHSKNFPGMELIRPLYLIREDDIKLWRDDNGLHFIQCACKFTDTCTTCSNEENRSKRVEVKALIRQMKKTNPDVEAHIFRSVENVNLSTVIAYKQDGVRHHFLDDYDEKE